MNTAIKSIVTSTSQAVRLASVLALGSVALFGTNVAFGETRVETVLGTVTKSDALTTTYIRTTPSDERFCRTEDVPVYGQAKSESSDLGAMIVGGLIGSAIGNSASDSNGAGAAGAFAGAILGREHAKKNQGQDVVGYRQQEVCEVRTVFVEENVEKITGYRSTIEVDNKIISVETSRPLALNERVEIERRITYAIR